MEVGRYCATCGAAATQRCARCVSARVAIPTYYCSTECQKANWKEHKKWHKAQEEHVAAEEENVRAQVGKPVRDLLDRVDEHNRVHGTEYEKLISSGRTLSVKDGNYKSAAKVFRRAIELEPERPEAYSSLAHACHLSKRAPEAAELFVKAFEREADGTVPWALAAGSAYLALMDPASKVTEFPSWWTAENLEVISDKMVKAVPGQPRAWHMRGTVLMGGTGAPGDPGVRTVDTMRDAAQCFRKAASLTKDDPKGRDAFLRQAQVVDTHLAQDLAGNERAIAAWKEGADTGAAGPPFGKFILTHGHSEACKLHTSKDSQDDLLAAAGLENGIPAPRVARVEGDDERFFMCSNGHKRSATDGWLELSLGTERSDGLKCDGTVLIRGVADDVKGKLWQPYLEAATPGKYTLHLSPSDAQELGVKRHHGCLTLCDSGLKDSNGEKVFAGRFCFVVEATKARFKKTGHQTETAAMHFLAFQAPPGAHSSQAGGDLSVLA